MSSSILEKPEPEVKALTKEQAKAVFEETLKNQLDITPEEFFNRLRSGEYAHCDCDTDEGTNLMSVLMLLPLLDDPTEKCPTTKL